MQSLNQPPHTRSGFCGKVHSQGGRGSKDSSSQDSMSCDSVGSDSVGSDSFEVEGGTPEEYTLSERSTPGS